MKRRKKKAPGLVELFQSTCGWCGKSIPPDNEVFAGSGTARPGIDLSQKAGQVMPLYLALLDKTVLVAIAGLDSEAKRDGKDFAFMTCSAACAESLRTAFQGEIELGNKMRLA
jgi:hypothetical protein